MTTGITFPTSRLLSPEDDASSRYEEPLHSLSSWGTVRIPEGLGTAGVVQGNWSDLNSVRFSTGTIAPIGIEVNSRSAYRINGQVVGNTAYIYTDMPDTRSTIWLIGTYLEPQDVPHYSVYILGDAVGSYFVPEEQFTRFANRHHIETLLGLDGMEGLKRLTDAIENYCNEKEWPLSRISVNYVIDAEVESWEYIQVDLKFTTSFEAADGILHELYPFLDSQLNGEDEAVRELLTRLVYFDI